MQILTYITKEQLYCDICYTVFSEELVKADMMAFQDIHRYIHKKMDLNTPDYPENEDIDAFLNEHNLYKMELSTKLSTDLSTDV